MFWYTHYWHFCQSSVFCKRRVGFYFCYFNQSTTQNLRKKKQKCKCLFYLHPSLDSRMHGKLVLSPQRLQTPGKCPALLPGWEGRPTGTLSQQHGESMGTPSCSGQTCWEVLYNPALPTTLESTHNPLLQPSLINSGDSFAREDGLVGTFAYQFLNHVNTFTKNTDGIIC